MTDQQAMPPVPAAPHIPVLVREITEFLITDPDGRYFDGTLGAGGHTAALLSHLSPQARILGVDLDPEATRRCRERFSQEPRVIVMDGSYNQLPELLQQAGWDVCDGLLLDLGLSSTQLEDPGRGFSFNRRGPLDMRFSPLSGASAEELLNTLTMEELAHILRTYGEEPLARRIAAAIEQERNRQKLQTTEDLAEIVQPLAFGPRRTKTLARVFQALRIAVNRELEHLQGFMDTALKYLAPGGRIAVISYHSLEDRIVKASFSYYRKGCICPPELPTCVCSKISQIRILTRKPVRPGADEVALNSRARSALLRVAEKLPNP